MASDPPGTKGSQFCKLRQYVPQAIKDVQTTIRELNLENLRNALENHEPRMPVAKVRSMTLVINQGFRVTNDDEQDLVDILCTTGSGPQLTIPIDFTDE